MKYRNSRICGTSPCLGLKPTKKPHKITKKYNKIDSENSPFENILKVHAESSSQILFLFPFRGKVPSSTGNTP